VRVAMAAEKSEAEFKATDDDDETVNYLAGGARSVLQLNLFQAFRTLTFDGIFATVVFLNLIFVIIESDITAKGDDMPIWMAVINIAFLLLYTVEIGLRLYIFRMAFFRLPWNCVDLGLVVADYLMMLVDIAFGGAPSLSFLRLLRLLKLTRGIKVMLMFPQLALMVKGLGKAFSIIIWGGVILTIALVAFGIFATQLIHPINQRVAAKGLYDGCERCPRAFASVAASVMTISQQIITGDSWGMLSIPIIEEAPETALFFSLCFAVISLMMLNVILAVVVETSSKAAAEDAETIIKNQEKEFQKSAHIFKNICRELDDDKSGTLTAQELNEGFENNAQFRQIMALMQIDRDDIDAVFNILDKDGSGDIDYDEFITEMYKMKSHDEHTMLVFLRYYVLEIKRMLGQMEERAARHSRRDVMESAVPPLVRPPDEGSIALRSPEEKIFPAEPTEVERELREALIHKVQAAVREELCVPMREFLATAERQASALDEVRQRLALASSQWRGQLEAHHGSYAPPARERQAFRAVNTPSVRCCDFVDARKGRSIISPTEGESGGRARSDQRGVDMLPLPVSPIDPYVQGAFGDIGNVPAPQQSKLVGSAMNGGRRF